VFARFGWESDEAFERQRGAQTAVFLGEGGQEPWQEH